MEILAMQEGLAVKNEYYREAEGKIEFWKGELEAKQGERDEHKKLVDEIENDKRIAEEREQKVRDERKAEWEAMTVSEGEEKPELETYNDPDAQSARENFDIQKPILDKLDREIEALRKDIERDYGPDKVWGGVYGECFEKQIKEYTYKFCPLDKIEQSGTSLGNFQGYEENYTVMLFDNGASCWQGPNRNTRVTLTCGSSNEIISVDEPSRCVYHMKATSPAVCNAEHIKALELSIDGGHDEL
eukprot:TRINITY_DN6806_c0_g1_i1.p1 TRINITY_DN6806_c0_g1~~TRINITY_DN6806_c0_g1_i1.p1  ORF type:complete len:244 (+),score=75.53 TRINITY_DN6806_c0_g1_i1:828-1559(+)